MEWLRVRGGDPFAWVALFPVGGSTATQASPAPTIGASVDGSVALAVPGSVTPGSYEVRLFALRRTVRISAPLQVTAGNARVVTGPVGDSGRFQTDW